MRLLFAELDRYWWPRVFVVGINQDGKTLSLMIMLCYLLFERRETTVWGIPHIDMAEDKWRIDFLPVLKNSQYHALMPKSGKGSRDGMSMLFQFENGTALRFMTAGGDDQSRANFTTQNLAVSEVEGFDKVGAESREGDKFSQLERRTLAFPEKARTICEGTAGIESGRTWHEYQSSTQSRIVLPCPHCSKWVTPEREHLSGWQDADNELAAIEHTFVACPECGTAWTNEERITANHDARLLHHGQQIVDGQVVGDPPKTNTLGFRWNCVNSIISPRRLNVVGGLEWKAKRAADEELADRDLRQSQWAMPAKPAKQDVRTLDAFVIMRRTIPKLRRGFCPPDTLFITAAIDIGKWLCHWGAVAWRPKATPHVIDYGVIQVPSASMSEEEAVLVALREWRDSIEGGWDRGGSPTPATLKFVDAGYLQDTVIAFCQESTDDGFVPVKGFGETQRRETGFKRSTKSKVIEVFDNGSYSLVELPDGEQIIEANADVWKSFLHARVVAPLDKASALTFYDPPDGSQNEHLTIGKHLIAESQEQEFVPGKGVITRWKKNHRQNHHLDELAMNCVAGHAAGARLLDDEEKETEADTAPPPRSHPYLGQGSGGYGM